MTCLDQRTSRRATWLFALTLCCLIAGLTSLDPLQPEGRAWAADDGTILPFPPAPSASIAAPTLKELKHVRRVEPNHLPAKAPPTS